LIVEQKPSDDLPNQEKNQYRTINCKETGVYIEKWLTKYSAKLEDGKLKRRETESGNENYTGRSGLRPVNCVA